MQNVNAQDTTVNAQPSVDLPNRIAATSGIEMIQLRHLVASPYNQRKKARTEATILEFADNIKAVDLLQNLVVHPMPKKAKKAQTYGVDAGETRRQALLLLVERGDITLDKLVPCKIISEADAILSSATENDLRKPAHPADQFLAYKALADEGRSPEFIAAVFKVTPKTVAGHLKLASISPALFELFADDKIELEQIQALAITDDHERQESAWFGAKNTWARQPHELRAVLRGDKLTLNDRVVKFVTVAAYEAAGGVVERDLFSERDEGFILNRDLLSRLFNEKVASTVEAIKADGWAWVESRPKFDYQDRNDFTQLEADAAPLNDEQQAHYDDLQARSDAICEKLQASEEADEGDEAHLSDDAYGALESEHEQISDQLIAIDEREGTFTPEQMKVSGAIVFIEYDGDLKVTRGLVRAEDREEAVAMMEASGAATIPRSLTAKPKAKGKGVHSEKLLLNLTAHRTAAVQSALTQNPLVALVTLTHRLALDCLYKGYGLDSLSPARIGAREATYEVKRSAPGIEQTDYASGLREHVQSWRAILPANPNELFAWLLSQPQERVLNVLALCTSLSLNGVARDEGPNAINTIAGALNLDFSTYWQPTQASYLGMVSKDRIVAIVTEVVSKEEGARLAKMKKGEAAQAAEKLLAGSNWLPEFMKAAEGPQVSHFSRESDEDEGDDAGEFADDDAEAAESADTGAQAAPVESGDMGEQPSAGHADDDAGQAVAAPLMAWPFPTTGYRTLEGMRHAA